MKEKLVRIHALLRYADEQQKAISDEYSNYLDGDVPADLQIRVKNYFENVRSLLDYIASDICVNILGLNANHKCYFPTSSSSKENFDRHCQRNFPDIELADPEIYKALFSVQAFHSDGYPALVQLSGYTNENKHRDLTVQRMVEESHRASRFLVVRLGEDITKTDECDGFMVQMKQDRTRSLEVTTF